MSPSPVEELLNSGGAKTFPFEHIGASVTGTIEASDVIQSRNFDTGEAEVWGDGKPKQLIRVTLHTSLIDPNDPDEDGRRAVYIKGWGDPIRTLRTAIRAAGDSDLRIGGTFTATYVGDGEPAVLQNGRKGFPPKMFQYEYVPPSATRSLLAEPPSQQPSFSQQTQTTWPVQQPASAPATQADPSELAAYEAWRASQQQGQAQRPQYEQPPF